MSADSTNVVQIFGYFQDKRFQRALEYLALAYEANLSSEENVLKALEQVGWEEESMTEAEKAYCVFLQARADELKEVGDIIRAIMRDIKNGVTYESVVSSD